MDPETSDAVTEWEPVAVGSGLAGLESLVADEFCGAVTDGLTWAFLLNGRIVGVFEGSIEAFEDADLTAYQAPDPALPLLFTMRESDGEVRGQYYSQKTSLSEVHRTLSSGSFTGYVELSENVLSGDYYVVYYGGRSMNVAFVGASERLVTGDEAFNLAADEVGIFTVTAVDIDIVDLPDGASAAAASTDSAEARSEPAESAGSAEPTDTDGADEPTGATDDAAGVTFGPSSATDSAADPTADDATESSADDSPRYGASDDLRGDMGIGLNVGDEPEPAADTAPDDADGSDELATDTDPSATDSVNADDVTSESADSDAEPTPDATVRDDTDAVEAPTGDTDDEPTVDDTGGADPGSTDAVDAADEGESIDSPGTAAAEDGTTADIADVEPTGIDAEVTNGQGRSTDTTSDDPNETAVGPTPEESTDAAPVPADDGDEAAAAGQASRTDAEQNGDAISAEQEWRTTRHIPALAPEESMDADDLSESDTDREADLEAASRDGATEAAAVESESSADAADSPAATTDDATADLAARLERAVADRDDLAAEVDRLESQLRTVTEERDELRSRLADLESEVDRLREAVAAAEAAGSTTGGSAGGGADDQQLSPAAAREGTNLFVRYRTKGQPTLAKARTGDAAQTDVVDNLRLEYHTTFDSESTTVAGDPYETFLHGTVEWGFATWVVEDLLYEIGRAGYRTELAPLFDAIPEIDRIQFNGEVPVTVQENGKDSHESRTFDLVFWNSMGDPLFVVNVDTDRNATTQSMVGSLIEGARAVGNSKGTLSSAFYVSNSFFDPGALDAVSEATKSGLLNRGSKKSFVKLSRKEGYHLCLVEARGGEFHLTVPEL